MTIWVLHESGHRELISLVEPVTFLEGLKLDRVVSGDGLEHWFTKDGYYDGWGRKMNGASDAEATAQIDAVEHARHVEPGPSLEAQDI